jgi:hypothetical protein
MKRPLRQRLLTAATGVVVAATVVLACAFHGMDAEPVLVIAAALVFLAAVIGVLAWDVWEPWRWWLWHRRTGRWLARRDALRSQGHCPECAYDLTGNVSGTCPECGAAIQ